jgi:hypothetical protein
LIRFLTILLLCAIPTEAATLYCSPSGGGSGADFNNLATLPNATGFTRGNTYVIIEGSYGSKTLSTATSGSTAITIRKANAEDSAVAGYATSLFDGQATFGTITVASQYWIVDGKTRTESNAWGAPAGYGFRATEVVANSLNGDDADNSQFRYIDIGATWEENPSAGTIAGYGNPIYLVYNQSSITFTRCAIHNGMGVQAAGANNLTFEYCHFGQMWGKQALRGGNGSTSSGWIVRYCRFKDSSIKDPNDGTSGTTGEICLWDSASGSFDNNAIYGNWFSHSRSTGRNTSIVIGGDGSSWAGVGGTGNVVHNNTWAGIDEASTFSMVDLNGSSNTARNNLFYDCVDTDVSANTTSDNDVAGADPFVSYATLDLRLSGATSPGTSLSSPYNTDPLGTTRGSDGTWDVGAYEYDSGGGDVTAPTMSSATIGTSGASITLAFNESVSVGAGGNGGFTVSLSGGVATLTYSSGSGSSSLVYTISRTVNQGETGTISYTQPGNGIEDTSGNDLATFSNSAVTNNSSQGSNPTPGVSVGSGVVFSNGVTGVK